MPMSRRETHTDCLERMFALRRFGIKLGLVTIRRMLAGLGNPHRRFACIRVAAIPGHRFAAVPPPPGAVLPGRICKHSISMSGEGICRGSRGTMAYPGEQTARKLVADESDRTDPTASEQDTGRLAARWCRLMTGVWAACTCLPTERMNRRFPRRSDRSWASRRPWTRSRSFPWVIPTRLLNRNT